MQAPEPVPVACTKTVTFAIAEGGQPVPAIPKFAAKWIGKAKHVEGFPDMCLAQIPSSKTANYVVIFSTTEASFDGLTPSAHTYTSTGPLSGNFAGVSSYGGTWNYSYTRACLRPPPAASICFGWTTPRRFSFCAPMTSRAARCRAIAVDSDHARKAARTDDG